MIDTSKFTDSQSQETVMPSLAQMNQSGFDLSNYRVRVEKFDLSDEENRGQIESLYTRSIDGSNDIVILDQKSFNYEEALLVYVFYMEQRPKDPMESVRENTE